jgi:hypothetical protein
MADHAPSAPSPVAKRLRLSRMLAVAGIVLMLISYTFGSLITYRSRAEDEANLSYKPFAWLEIDEKTEHPTSLDTLKAYVGGYNSLPIWRVSLEAPQYPKAVFPDGIPVFFNLTRFTGEVQEMNTINHYIGMEPMEVGATGVRRAVPWICAIFLLGLIAFVFYDGPGFWVLGLGPGLLWVYFLGIFSYWLYWFGHNLHEYGAFKIKPFMPTVLGDGKVAQFTTHSYPYWGFYVLAAESIVLVMAILIRRRALREAKAVAAAPEAAA